MTILVVGGSGATGRLLVQQLLNCGQNVKVIVRSPDNLPEVLQNHDNLSVIQASVLGLSDVQMAHHVNGCDAVASCLGHNTSLKGIVRTAAQAFSSFASPIQFAEWHLRQKLAPILFVQCHQGTQVRRTNKICAHEHGWQQQPRS